MKTVVLVDKKTGVRPEEQLHLANLIHRRSRDQHNEQFAPRHASAAGRIQRSE